MTRTHSLLSPSSADTFSDGTEASIFNGDLPDNNLNSWVEFIQSPRNHLMLDLSIIGVGDALQEVQYQTLVKILTPCGIMYLHSYADIFDRENDALARTPFGADYRHMHHFCPKPFSEDIRILLGFFAKKESRKLSSSRPDPDKPSRVGLGAWFTRNNAMVVRELLFENPGVGCQKKKTVVRDLCNRMFWIRN